MSEIPALLTDWTPTLPGEPRFGLRGSDPEAPKTILFWARNRRERLMREPRSEKLEAELAQCSEAEAIAWLMKEFQAGTMETQPESIPEELKDNLKNSLHFARRVDNAVSECTEAIAYLNQFGAIPPQFAHSIKHLKRLADHLRKLHGGR